MLVTLGALTVLSWMTRSASVGLDDAALAADLKVERPLDHLFVPDTKNTLGDFTGIVLPNLVDAVAAAAPRQPRAKTAVTYLLLAVRNGAH